MRRHCRLVDCPSACAAVHETRLGKTPSEQHECREAVVEAGGSFGTGQDDDTADAIEVGTAKRCSSGRNSNEAVGRSSKTMTITALTMRHHAPTRSRHSTIPSTAV